MGDKGSNRRMFRLRAQYLQEASRPENRVRELLELNRTLLDEYAKANNCQIVEESPNLPTAGAV
jgi:ribosome biogenesis protein Tsr3